MYARGRKLLLQEKERDDIRLLLVLDKDHGSFIADIVEDLDKSITLLHSRHFVHGLRHVCVGAAEQAHGQKYVVMKMVLCQFLNLFGKRGRKHERATLSLLGNLIDNIIGLKC